MRRREFLGVLSSGAAAAWSSGSLAQKAPIRIGLLGSGAATSVITAAQVATIKEGLRGYGLIDGRDYLLDARFAAGRYERFPELARELAQAGAAVILTNTIASVRAAQRLTPPVPVVMLAINDPIGTGLIASLAKPGNHTTGLATLNEDLTPGAMGIVVQPAGLKSPDVLDATFAELAGQKPAALLILSDSGVIDLSDRIAALAVAHRLPTFSTSPTVAEFGGLLAYGAPRHKLFLRSAYFVKRIFDGANAGDLPVEQPTQIELWINLKTAKILGLDMPLHLQQLADKVIE